MNAVVLTPDDKGDNGVTLATRLAILWPFSNVGLDVAHVTNRRRLPSFSTCFLSTRKAMHLLVANVLHQGVRLPVS